MSGEIDRERKRSRASTSQFFSEEELEVIWIFRSLRLSVNSALDFSGESGKPTWNPASRIPDLGYPAKSMVGHFNLLAVIFAKRKTDKFDPITLTSNVQLGRRVGDPTSDVETRLASLGGLATARISPLEHD